jgi:vancomycin resistance protein VanW
MKPQKKLLSQRHPFFYFISVWEKRIRRYARWFSDGRKYASLLEKETLPYRVREHQSVLLRQLGKSEMQLQINKVTNLRLAVRHLDGIIIRPGEVFSYCRLVGRPTQAKGYLPGMELSFGEPTTGIGGGICQIANLIHWLVLHSPLTVTERHRHSFDPFPDEGRVIPFGTGATIFFNYRDYQFANHTDRTFQLRIWLSDTFLHGELYTDAAPDYTCHIFEREHQFLKVGDTFYRKNEIWREKQTPEGITEELLTKNFARVMYVPTSFVEAGQEDIRQFQD